MKYGQSLIQSKNGHQTNGHKDPSVKMLPKHLCKKINLACGNMKMDGYTGIDILKEGTVADFICNLESYPWPILSDSVEQIFCSHFLEHVDDLLTFMDEVYRVLKPNGTAVFVCPYYTSVRAWQDPTHKRVISDPLFYYFDKDWRKAANVLQYPIVADFKVEKLDHSLSEEFAGKAQDAIQYAANHYWNVVTDIMATLRKKKK